MLVEIRKEAFNAWQEIMDYSSNFCNGEVGATSCFVGSMRDFNEGKNITKMILEYYPGMTESFLNDLAIKSIEKWKLQDVIILHRVGDVEVSEDIVLIGTWSHHRKQAFESCREIMEELKSKAPFWKKEQTALGSEHWVEKNTKGY